jgi:hypothetical protein
MHVNPVRIPPPSAGALSSRAAHGTAPPMRSTFATVGLLAALAAAALSPGGPWLLRAGDGTPADLALTAALLATLLWAVRAPDDLRPTAVDVGVGAGLVVVAALPVLPIPFTTDAQVLRAAFAKLDLFADWNHPFLPYLLNRPVASVSMDPVHLRLVPLLFAAGVGGLLAAAAQARAGRLAGWFAAAWFAAELRERHGLTDLGDWDFAGAFLMTWLVWLDRPATPSPLRSAGLALLIAAGLVSSWLMVIPAAALVAVLWLDVASGARPAWSAALPTLTVAAVATWARLVYAHGAALGPPSLRPLAQLAEEIAAELPTDRAPAMAWPLLLGVGVLVAGRRGAAERFTALSLVAVPAALAWAWLYSHVNGGYYFGLVTPLLLWAAAVGAGRALAAVPGPRALSAAALAVATISAARFPFLSWTGGAERVPTIDAEVVARSTPVVTNWIDLGRVAAWERARRGEGDDADMIEDGGPPELAAVTRHLVVETCQPVGGWPNGEHLLVLVQPDRVIAAGCDPDARGCVALDPDVRPVPFARTWRCPPAP